MVCKILCLNIFFLCSKQINNAYEAYVLSVGDFDERIFLGDEASVEIGTPAKSTFAETGELAEKLNVKKDLRQSFEVTIRPKKNYCLFPVSMTNFLTGSVGKFFFI